jgi:D-alanyl-D-alanine carboxypeptidase
LNFIRVMLAVLCLCAPGLAQEAPNPVQPSPPAPAIKPAELARKLDAALQELSAKDEFSGVVLVAQKGAPVFQKAYGLQSQEYGVPNNLETKFNVGSIDKIFTEIAIGQLLEQGKIASVDDNLEKYLPDYPNHEAASTVTLRQILNMQSGIGDFFGPDFRSSPKDKFRSIADYLPLFAGKPLAFPPGTKRQYANGGFIVLGAVIEKLTGGSYYDYVRDNIFKPLGMEHTDFYEGDVPTPNLASGYTHRGSESGPRRNNIYTRPAKGSSAGGGYSTAGDLLKFANAMDAGKIKMPSFEEDAPKPPNASLGSMRGIGIAGGAPGLNAALETGLPGGYAIVVLSNYDPPSADEVSGKIHECMGLPVDRR